MDDDRRKWVDEALTHLHDLTGHLIEHAAADEWLQLSFELLGTVRFVHRTAMEIASELTHEETKQLVKQTLEIQMGIPVSLHDVYDEHGHPVGGYVTPEEIVVPDNIGNMGDME